MKELGINIGARQEGSIWRAVVWFDSGKRMSSKLTFQTKEEAIGYAKLLTDEILEEQGIKRKPWDTSGADA